MRALLALLFIANMASGIWAARQTANLLNEATDVFTNAIELVHERRI